MAPVSSLIKLCHFLWWTLGADVPGGRAVFLGIGFYFGSCWVTACNGDHEVGIAKGGLQ
jgi:hypothetical protein